MSWELGRETVHEAPVRATECAWERIGMSVSDLCNSLLSGDTVLRANNQPPHENETDHRQDRNQDGKDVLNNIGEKSRHRDGAIPSRGCGSADSDCFRRR